MQHLGYMAAAYAIIWAVILVYFVGLGRREREIWTELQELRESLRKRKSHVNSGEHQQTT